MHYSVWVVLVISCTRLTAQEIIISNGGTYTNDRSKYELVVPKGWEIHEEQSGTVGIYQPGKEKYYLRPNLSIIVAEWALHHDSTTFFEFNLRNLLQGFENVDFNITKITQGTLEGKVYENLEIPANESSGIYVCIQYAFYHNGIGYVILASGEKDKILDIKNFYEMVGSFYLIP